MKSELEKFEEKYWRIVHEEGADYEKIWELFRNERQRLLQEILKEINYYIKHYGLQNWGGSDIKNAKELLKFSDKLKSLIK